MIIKNNDSPDYEFLKKLLPSIIWDYIYDPNDICEVVLGKSDQSGHFTREHILLRMIQRLRWYDIIRAVGITFVKNNLSPFVIERIRDKTTRQQYERVAKILHGETVSFSGWDSEYRRALEFTLLSHRWYRA